MARGFVRWSLQGDEGSRLRNRLVPALERNGFKTTPGTATLEATGLSLDAILEGLREAFDEIEHSQPDRGVLDHLWVYVDAAADDSSVLPPRERRHSILPEGD
jgi:hypothetical protein